MSRKVVLALIVLTSTTSAMARGGQEVTTEFYNDATRAKLVGEVIVGCGAHGQWGRRTAFYTHSSSPCGGLRRSTTSIAATSLMHHDPVAACRFRCDHLPLKICPPPSANQPDCVQPRDACRAACNQLLDTDQ